MASTNKTPNLELSQFLGSDKLQRTDYNGDMLKIDEAVGNLTLDDIPDGDIRKLADANKIAGIAVDISEIEDGQSLVYDEASNSFLSADVGGGALPIINPISGSIELLPFVQYEFGEIEALTLSFAPAKAGYSARYIFTFTSGAVPTDINVPANVKWVADLSPLSNKTYMVTVDAVQAGYIASYREVDKLPSKSAFITTWNMPADEVSIPSQNGTYDCVVDWGDGSSSNHTTGALTHVYTDAGQYQITIEGQYNGFVLAADEVSSYLVSIDQWGDVGFTSMANAFNGCANLIDIASPLTGAAYITDFSTAFASCSSLTTIPSNLFSGCIGATHFFACFAGCSSLTSIPDALFKTCLSAISFENCFIQCSSIETIPVGLFENCVNAITFRTCFNGCSSLVAIPLTLFDNCPDVAEFIACFAGDTGLAGEAPELWLTHPSALGYSCFAGCTGLSNYDSIPAEWK